MPNVLGIEYEATSEGLRDAIAKLRLPNAEVRMGFADLPQEIVHFEFHGDASLYVLFPNDFASKERADFFTFRMLAAVPLFHFTRRRYPSLSGSVFLNTDDVPSSGTAAFCSNSPFHLLIPDSEFLAALGYFWMRGDDWNRNWDDKADLVFWRGASTGKRTSNDWRGIQRIRLCILANENSPSLFNVGLSDIVQLLSEEEYRAVGQANLVKPRVMPEEFGNFRYLIDIDGNSCAWSGLFTKLLTGSTVIKVSSPWGYRQWYYDRLIPWINFVPVRADMSDLIDVIGWLRQHPKQAAQIGAEGRKLALSVDYEGALESSSVHLRTLAQGGEGWLSMGTFPFPRQ